MSTFYQYERDLHAMIATEALLKKIIAKRALTRCPMSVIYARSVSEHNMCAVQTRYELMNGMSSF